MNRKKVYSLLAGTGEASRAEISRRTRISAPTVMKIVSFLISNEFVLEVGAGDSNLGRKPRILRFNPGCRHSIGVEFEGDFLKVGIVDLAGGLVGFRQIEVGKNFEHILRHELISTIRELIASSDVPSSTVIGLGMGIPGVVDADSGVLEFAPLVGVFSPKDCKDLLREVSVALGMPVFIKNNVNAAAFGEYTARRLSKHGELLYVAVGTGLGAGIIINGSLRKGRHNSAGEIGYMVFDSEFESSKAHPGWLESRVSLDTLRGDDGSAAPRPLSSSAVESLSANLALCIANLTTLIDMDLVVLGGITVELVGQQLFEEVNRKLKRLSVVNVQCERQQCAEPGVVGAGIIASTAVVDRLLLS